LVHVKPAFLTLDIGATINTALLLDACGFALPADRRDHGRSFMFILGHPFDRLGVSLFNRSISVAGDYCERVLPLAAGILHQQAQAVDAMTFRQFRNQPGSDERS